MTIDAVRPEDTSGVLGLLEQNKLPVAGLADHLGTAIAARDNGRIVGTAALEVYDDGALLRSVAVAPDLQGRGLGQQLTIAALDLAKAKGVPAVYLLTTTAERFFPKFGFERITRAEVPSQVQTSVEFVSACPASAVVMRKALARS